MDLNQVTIPSVNLDQSVSFYLVLGLELIVDARPDYVRFLCPSGSSTFSVHRVSNLPTGNGIAVYFECHDLDQKVQSLLDQGVQFQEPIEEKPWLWKEARLLDPDHNLLVLFYAGKNRIDPPWRIH